MNSELNIFQRNAKAVVILAVMAGSTSGVLGKLIDAPSMAIGFYRLLFALPFFLIPIIIKHKESIKKVHKKDFVMAILSGMFLFLHFWTWFIAVKTTNIASATVLMSLHPLVVAFVSVVIWKKKVPGKAMVGIILALVGGTLIAGFDFINTPEAIAGDILAFIAGASLGIYFCFGNVVRKRVQASIYVFIVFASCFVCFLLGMIISGTPFTGYSVDAFFWIVVMTLICQLGAHATFNWSMGYVSSLFLSAWETCEIVFATILAALIFSQIPTLWQIVGGVIVIGGLLYYDFHERDNG